MAGLTDVFNLMGNLPSLLDFMESVFFLMICFFLGSFVWSAWKRYKNWGLSVIATLALGVAVMAGSVILAQAIPFRMPYMPYSIHALIIASLLYLILHLFSAGTKRAGKFVTGESFNKLSEELSELKERFHRLLKLLEKKKITPEQLSDKEAEKSLRAIMESKGIKEFSINTRKTIDEELIFNIKSKKNYYEASLDSYTGELMSFNRTNLNFFEHITEGFRKLTSNPKLFTATILTFSLLLLMFFLATPQALSEIESNMALISSPLGFTQSEFADYQVANNTCLSATDSLYIIKTESYSDYETNYSLPVSIAQQLRTKYPSESIVKSSLITYNNTDYAIVILTSLSEEELNNALTNYLTKNLLGLSSGSINFCDITHDSRSISNYYRACSIRINDSSFCDCPLVKDATSYCSVLSEELLQQVTSQLSGVTQELQGLLGALG